VLVVFAAVAFPIVLSRNSSLRVEISSLSPSSSCACEEKNAVSIDDCSFENETGVRSYSERSSGAVIGAPRATVYLFLGVGLTLVGRAPGDIDFAGRERVGTGLAERGRPDEEASCGEDVMPRPTGGRPDIYEWDKDVGECVGDSTFGVEA
jgi:hypothetical protein